MSVLPYAAYVLCAGVVGYWNNIAPPGSPDYTPVPKHHFRALFENDSVSGSDCNYTHGTRIDYAQLMSNNDAWCLSLTQNIYTPETHAYHKVTRQHPYCGYLALGAGYIMRGENIGCSTELQVGMTGKPSLAGEMQNRLHEVFHMETWNGWHDQIRSEATVQLTSRQDFLVPWLSYTPTPGWQTDGLFYLRESVGTFNISGTAGLSFRFGHNLPPTSQVTGNNAAVYGLGSLITPSYRREDCSYFIVLEGAVSYVARDMPLEGGVFHSYESTCTRVPWQPEGRAGFCLIYHGVEYYAGAFVRNRTYKSQDKNSVLGNFTITWHW